MSAHRTCTLSLCVCTLLSSLSACQLAAHLSFLLPLLHHHSLHLLPLAPLIPLFAPELLRWEFYYLWQECWFFFSPRTSFHLWHPPTFPRLHPLSVSSPLYVGIYGALQLSYLVHPVLTDNQDLSASPDTAAHVCESAVSRLHTYEGFERCTQVFIPPCKVGRVHMRVEVFPCMHIII